MRKTLQINIAVDTWIRDECLSFYRESGQIYIDTVQSPERAVKISHKSGLCELVKIDDLKRAIAAAERGMR